MKRICVVGGARPNFMKIAPIIRALEQQRAQFSFTLVHTGQHYDREMSGVFFDELGIPKPDFHLDAGSGSHARQTAKIMTAFEDVCQKERPDCVLVVGDVNSTLACSIVAKKMNIPVAHVEAGLRSGDRLMPEEINRLVTDAITDWFFATESAAVTNLLREGKSEDCIFFVGHVMVDNLLYQRDRLENAAKSDFFSETLKRQHAKYGVVTLHRPSNVDHADVLAGITQALREISDQLPLVFPVHPRTRTSLEKAKLDLGPNILLTRPMSYMDFLNLWKDATVILTDSGGLQEETTALGVPCITLRENTERPVTVEEGTNVLVGSDTALIVRETLNILSGAGKRGQRPKLWDGRAAQRIVSILASVLA